MLCLKALRTKRLWSLKYAAKALFCDYVLSNNDMFKHLRSKLSGMDLEPDPSSELQQKARTFIKVAYLMYPGVVYISEQTKELSHIN